MIVNRKFGDILSMDDNPFGDIIIAMNTDLQQLSALARNFVGGSINGPIEKGTVLTFKNDGIRRIHMIVVHDLCVNGWKDSHKYLRIGLDLLWMGGRQDMLKKEVVRMFSIVQIGNGKVGRKYDADTKVLEQAMEDSFLALTLFKDKSTSVGAVLEFPQQPDLEIVEIVKPRAMAAAA